MGTLITVLFLVITVALVLFIFGLQAYLSSMENYWLGLILPGVFIFFSVVSSMAFVEEGMFWAMLYWNAPTFVMMIIYFVMRRSVKKAKKAMENGEDIPPVDNLIPKSIFGRKRKTDD